MYIPPRIYKWERKTLFMESAERIIVMLVPQLICNEAFFDFHRNVRSISINEIVGNFLFQKHIGSVVCFIQHNIILVCNVYICLHQEALPELQSMLSAQKIRHVDKLYRLYPLKLNYHFCLFCLICLKAVGLPVSLQVPIKANKNLIEQSICRYK